MVSSGISSLKFTYFQLITVMNTFGRLFRVTTFGESHGPAVGAVVDGCPSNLELSESDIQSELDRRRPGQGDMTTPRDEADRVKILSGVFEGRTIGSPICMIVENKDADPTKYREFIDLPRPGHADLTYLLKYGHRDWRGGGRASARETIGRVASGAIAAKILGKHCVCAIAYAKQIGSVKSEESLDMSMTGVRDLIDSNSVRALDVEAALAMEDEIRRAKAQGDSVGGVIECVIPNPPYGLGEPVFGKITSELSRAFSSIPAVKGVEFGAGFEAALMHASQFNDEMMMEGNRVKTKTNNAGGTLGGITYGMPIVAKIAFKPTPSISKAQKTVNLKSGRQASIKITGRHDPCVIPRAVPVVEAMANLVLIDHMLLSGLIPRRL
jgi:chorismate synthase